MSMKYSLLCGCIFAFLTLIQAVRAEEIPSAAQNESPKGEVQNPGASEESMTLEAKPAEAAPVDFDSTYREEREKFLAKVKNSIDPNLIQGDKQRLSRNVMRLGSYRKDWVQSSQDFLAANAALGEPYIFRYVALQNKRLNVAALQTLDARFPTFREPRAVLTFLNFFVSTPEEAALALQVLAKAIDQDPGLAAESIQFLDGPIGQRFPLQNRLQLGVKACAKLSSAALASKEILKKWRSQASSFWESVVGDELDSCLKGA